MMMISWPLAVMTRFSATFTTELVVNQAPASQRARRQSPVTHHLRRWWQPIEL